MSLSDEEYLAVLRNEDLYYKHCLRIRTKAGEIVPFEMNRAQRMVGEVMDRQLQEKGKVRLLIPKARQMGVSTYIQARFYRKTSNSKGIVTTIITHEDRATSNLFGMTHRFQANNLPEFTPSTSRASANELAFGQLDSQYLVATAGARTSGRSSTIHCLHASEFDYWPDAHADENWAGLYGALSKEAGTYAVVETTVREPGGRFHRLVKAALRGDSEYEVLFLPWFIHEDYVKRVPSRWEPPQLFREYGLTHGLTKEQVYWAYCENRDMAVTLGVSPDEFCTQFKREYPATLDEAFEQAGDDLVRVFPISWVRAAQDRWRANTIDGRRMRGLGVDVAQGGEDKTAKAPWYGSRLEAIETIPGELSPDGPAVAASVVQSVRDNATIAVDTTGGWGGDTLTHLKKHLSLPAIGVNSSQKAARKSACGQFKFINDRAALHWALREALNPESGEDVELWPDPELEEELLACEFEVMPSGIKILSKDVIRQKIGRSPDKLDAALLGWRAAGINSKQVEGSRIRALHAAKEVHQPRAKVRGHRR